MHFHHVAASYRTVSVLICFLSWRRIWTSESHVSSFCNFSNYCSSAFIKPTTNLQPVTISMCIPKPFHRHSRAASSTAAGGCHAASGVRPLDRVFHTLSLMQSSLASFWEDGRYSHGAWSCGDNGDVFCLCWDGPGDMKLGSQLPHDYISGRNQKTTLTRNPFPWFSTSSLAVLLKDVKSYRISPHFHCRDTYHTVG